MDTLDFKTILYQIRERKLTLAQRQILSQVIDEINEQEVTELEAALEELKIESQIRKEIEEVTK